MGLSLKAFYFITYKLLHETLWMSFKCIGMPRELHLIIFAEKVLDIIVRKGKYC